MGVGTGGGVDTVRDLAPPHETRAPDATTIAIAAAVLGIALLSAEMAPEVGEEA